MLGINFSDSEESKVREYMEQIRNIASSDCHKIARLQSEIATIVGMKFEASDMLHRVYAQEQADTARTLEAGQ